MANDKRVIVIGIGGIGGCLLPVLLKYLELLNVTSDANYSVCLVDGDEYEEKNRHRQFFRRHANKAQVTREMFRDTSALDIFATPEFVTEENVSSIIREGMIVFLCVDNHGARKIVSDRCRELDSVVLISGGNELDSGNIQNYIREDGLNMCDTLRLDNDRHPEIAEPDKEEDEGVAEEVGCDVAMHADPQIIITNNAIASLMLSAFYSYLQGSLDFLEVYLDVPTCATRAVRIPQEELPANNGQANNSNSNAAQ